MPVVSSRYYTWAQKWEEKVVWKVCGIYNQDSWRKIRKRISAVTPIFLAEKILQHVHKIVVRPKVESSTIEAYKNHKPVKR